MMTSFMRMSQKLVFHQSNCICAITHILSTTAMYVSSSSFMYLRIPCYSDACLNSSALRVGVKTLLNTIQLVQDLRVCFSITATLLCLFSFMHLCVTSKCHVCSLLFLCGWVWRRHTMLLQQPQCCVTLSYQEMESNQKPSAWLQ